MHIDIITCAPKLLESPFNQSILSVAQKKKIVYIGIHNLRAYGKGKYRQIDDYIYGHDAGMVLMIEPIVRCIEHLKSERNYNEIIYMTPEGTRFNQKMANSLSLKENLMLICGHYKGIDQRVRDHYITQEISIGDYVLSGGELAAAVVSDAIIRIIPGVLGNSSSALTDSFQDDLLSAPIYSRPANFRNMEIPKILLSGNKAKIDEWTEQQAFSKTKKKRPDIWKRWTKKQ